MIKIDPLAGNLIALILLCIVLVAQTGYNEELYKKSLTYIPNIQAGASQAAITGWGLYSTYGLAGIMGAPLVVTIYMTKERARCFYYLVLFIGCATIMNTTKLFYHEPRPIWVDPNIQAFGCSAQYGNPSGHALCSFGISFGIWLDLNSSNKEKWHWGIRAGLLAVVITFAATIGYSRLFLGVHSINQITFGYTLGLWFSLVLHFLYRDAIYEMSEQLIKGNQENLQVKNIYAAIIFVLCYIAEIYNYGVANNFENNPSWSIEITEKCGADKLNNAYQVKGIVDFGLIGAAFGGFYGLTASAAYMPGLLVTSDLGNSCAQLKRFLVRFLAVAPLLLLMVFVGVNPNAVWIAAIFKQFVPMTVGAFGLFFYGDWINDKIGLFPPLEGSNAGNGRFGKQANSSAKAQDFDSFLSGDQINEEENNERDSNELI